MPAKTRFSVQPYQGQYRAFDLARGLFALDSVPRLTKAQAHRDAVELNDALGAPSEPAPAEFVMPEERDTYAVEILTRNEFGELRTSYLSAAGEVLTFKQHATAETVCYALREASGADHGFRVRVYSSRLTP
jgi:hypothetical protein